jgi:hypothetical protein
LYLKQLFLRSSCFKLFHISMYYISIGAFCNVKYQIDKYNDGKETLFFDYLISSMSSVIQLLESNNINQILNNNSIIRNPHNSIKNVWVVI